MAQIFVSHSQRDVELVNFFLRAFAGTNVKPIFQELEKNLPTGITAEGIELNIKKSSALFVLLSENVEKLKHTRDWVTWEGARAEGKDVWIFEPAEQYGKITVLFPRFNHYAKYERSDEWRKYLRDVIESYDNSDVLPALSLTTGAGAALDERDRGSGAFKGLLVGAAYLALTRLSRPTFGKPVSCGKCYRAYSLHLTAGVGQHRCANCNARYIIQPTVNKQVTMFGKGTLSGWQGL